MKPRRLIVLAFMLSAVAALAPMATAQDPPEETPPDGPACPTSIHGQALRDGGIFFSWTLNSMTDVNIYRAEGDGAFEFQERLEFPATRHIDHDTEAGTTYRYHVTAIDDNGTESVACETLEVTAIPFFPSWIGMVGAVGVATAGYAVLRRRR
jgi:hypothetical protein